MSKTTRNSQFVIPPPPGSSVAVRRIICVGRNYAAHALEMGRDPERERPFFFLKPADTVVDDGATVPCPPETNNFHCEIEPVVAIGKGGADIPVDRALEHVFGHGGATCSSGRASKDAPGTRGRRSTHPRPSRHSTPSPKPVIPGARIWLAVNGETKQDSDIAKLIWPVAAIVSIASRSMALCPGGLFMTGTPEGVGPVRRGEVVTGGIDGLGEIKIAVH